jgi:hypothetical protein
MEKLEQKIDRLTAAFEKFVDIHEQQNEDWIGPDAACKILGIKATESGSHRRQLKRLEDLGYLTKVLNSKPKRYWKKQVKDVSFNLSRGRVKF